MIIREKCKIYPLKYDDLIEDILLTLQKLNPNYWAVVIYLYNIYLFIRKKIVRCCSDNILDNNCHKCDDKYVSFMCDFSCLAKENC